MPSQNDDAWVKVPLWGLLGYALLIAGVLPLTDGSLVLTATWLLMATVIGIGVVVMVATHADRAWGWRPYALTVPVSVLVVAGGLGLLRQADPALSEGPPTAAPPPMSGGTDLESVASVDGEDAPPSRYRLTAPPSKGHWSRFQNREIRAAMRDVSHAAAETYGVADIAAGYYEHSSAPGTGVLYVGVNGTIDAPSAETVGREALGGDDGRIVTFPVRAPAWLGCGNQTSVGRTWVSCAWVTHDRAIFLRWDDDSVSTRDAAALTRSFRVFAGS